MCSSDLLLEAIVLVLVLLLAFLGNLRAALVVALMLPLAALATFVLLRERALPNPDANHEPGLAGAVRQLASTARRARPFCILRLSTVFPFAVFLRTRKPCVFARFRFLGWYVTDMGRSIKYFLLFFNIAHLSFVV